MGVSRSEQVRRLLKSDFNLPASVVIDTLSSRGVKVSRSLVYMVRSSMKKKLDKVPNVHSSNSRVPVARESGIAVLVSKLREVVARLGKDETKQLVDLVWHGK